MPRKATKLELHQGDFEYLHSLIKQRTIQAQVVIRAHILLDKSNGVTIRDIAKIYDLSTNTVRLCINNRVERENKFLAPPIEPYVRVSYTALQLIFQL